MPNTPALVGKGMTGLFACAQVDAAGKSAIEQVVATTGQFVWVDQEAHLDAVTARSEEHTSELQSPCNLVCRLLLEKKKEQPRIQRSSSCEHQLSVVRCPWSVVRSVRFQLSMPSFS